MRMPNKLVADFSNVNTFEKANELTDQLMSSIHKRFGDNFIAVCCYDTNDVGCIEGSGRTFLFATYIDALALINAFETERNCAVKVFQCNSLQYALIMEKHFDSIGYSRCLDVRVKTYDNFLLREYMDCNVHVYISD